jgi:PAS domain S-box-containing protein
MSLVADLILNLSLITSLGFLSNYLFEKFYFNKTLNLYYQSILFIVITIFSISNPIIIDKNFIFDARSITSFISALFFGIYVGLPTSAIGFLYRVYIIKGDIDFLSTFSVFLIPLILGLVFNFYYKNKKFKISLLSLFLIGFLNSSLIFLSLLLLLTPNISLIKFLEIQRAAIIVYPIFTMIFGYIIHLGINKVSLNQKIQESESLLKSVYHSISEILIILNLNGKILDINQSFGKIFSVDHISFKYKFFSDSFKLFDLETQEKIGLDFSSERLNNSQIIENKHILVELQGIKVPVRMNINQIFSKENEVTGYVITMIDIRDELKAKHELELSEKTFKGIFDTVQEAIYIQNENGVFIDVNRGAILMQGYDKEEFIGQTPLFFSVNEKNKHLNIPELIKKAFNGEPQSFEFWGRKKDGTIFPKFVRLQSGNYFGKKVIISTAFDLTPIKQAEEEKQIMLNKLAQIVENYDSGVVLQNDTGTLDYLNQNFIKIFKTKKSKESLLQKNVDIIFNLIEKELKNSDNFREIIDNCLKFSLPKKNMEFETFDNRIINLSYFPIVLEGKIKNHLWIFNDITNKKLYEKKLKSNISELEKFNKIMIEREIKMMELKKEINDLLSKLGLPEKYKLFSE